MQSCLENRSFAHQLEKRFVQKYKKKKRAGESVYSMAATQWVLSLRSTCVQCRRKRIRGDSSP